MFTDVYISMKELAKLFGSTQKKIGLGFEKKKLWVVGSGEATPKAIREGYISKREYPNKTCPPLTIWQLEKTIAALESIGFKLLPMYAAYSSLPKVTDEDESEHDEHEDEREDEHEDEDTYSNWPDRTSRDDGYGHDRYDGHGEDDHDDDFRRFDND